MSWWGWVLVVWVVLALAGAVVLGRSIRTAERRDRGQHGDEDLNQDDEWGAA
ncbi:MAG TPA: hypothetical protein VHF92_08125 [Geodermatophilus sp.]|nr:hypothetical protein [Geodermatophilus sp.]